MADTTPPTATAVGLPDVDLNAANPTATFSVTTADDLSGANSVSIFFDKPISYLSSGQVITSSAFVMSAFGGGSFSMSHQLSQFAVAGTYRLTNLHVQDNAGNIRSYSTADLTSLGLDTTFTFTGGTADTTAPTPTAVALPDVNLNAANPTAAFSVTLADDLSGANSVSIFFDKPISYLSSGQVITSSAFVMTAGGGGSFSMSHQLSQFAQPGAYRVTNLHAQDNAGNFRSYSTTDLASLGLDTMFTFTGGTADTTPPTATAIGLPDVDLSVANPIAAFSVSVADNLSGANSVSIFFDKAISYLSGGQVITSSAFVMTASGGGSFSMSHQLSQFAQPGTYHVTNLVLQDNAGNLRSYSLADLGSFGLDSEFVFNGTPQPQHAPVITSNGGGDTAVVVIPETTKAVTTVVATDADAGTALAYSIVGGSDSGFFHINASTGVLSFSFAPDFETPLDSGHDNTYAVRVRASDGSFTDDQTITVVVTDLPGSIVGDDGNNTLLSTAESETIDGRGGDDTAVFSGNLSSVLLGAEFADKILLLNLTGFDTLISIEHLRFADGTIDVQDGNVMFDPVFYSIQNSDVFHAGGNALAHFNAFGWREGRDPNQYVDTSWYQSVYKDAAGMNPLDHYHTIGWKKGYDPGPSFDTKYYLVNNPDVAAAGIDPLEHYMRYGAAEGRAIRGAIGDAVNGFDAQYYLLNNPDVAAAGVDPLQHFNTNGWREGRNPNAYFDTAGYLSHYADIAAAGINPLQHYQQLGWREGRDPSLQFDTLKYLAANPDVAAAGINPLDHFLNNGIYENRVPIADGIWH